MSTPCSLSRAVHASLSSLSRPSVYSTPARCRITLVHGSSSPRRTFSTRPPAPTASPASHQERIISNQPTPKTATASHQAATDRNSGLLQLEPSTSEPAWTTVLINDNVFFCENSDAKTLDQLRSEVVSIVKETPWKLSSIGDYMYRVYTFTEHTYVIPFLERIRSIARPRTEYQWAVASNRIYLRMAAIKKGHYGFSKDVVNMIRKSDQFLSRLGEGVLSPNSDNNFRYSAEWARQDYLTYPIVQKFSSRRKAWEHCRTLLEGVETAGGRSFFLVSNIDNFVYKSQATFTVSPHYGVHVEPPGDMNEHKSRLRDNLRSQAEVDFRNPVPGQLEKLTYEVSRGWKQHCQGYSLEEWETRVLELEGKRELRDPNETYVVPLLDPSQLWYETRFLGRGQRVQQERLARKRRRKTRNFRSK